MFCRWGGIFEGRRGRVFRWNNSRNRRRAFFWSVHHSDFSGMKCKVAVRPNPREFHHKRFWKEYRQNPRYGWMQGQRIGAAALPAPEVRKIKEQGEWKGGMPSALFIFSGSRPWRYRWAICQSIPVIPLAQMNGQAGQSVRGAIGSELGFIICNREIVSITLMVIDLRCRAF